MLVELLGNVLVDAFWSGLAALGFAILFQVPPRALVGCVVAGAVGHALRKLLMDGTGLSMEAGTLFGATAVGFVAAWFSRRLKAPAVIFSICGAIPMVPGFIAFSAMESLVGLTVNTGGEQVTLLVDGMVNLIRTILILGALAVGILMPRLLFIRPKPVV